MSTKSSIAHGPDFHLYREAFDEENVHLSMDGVEFKAEANRVVVSIPIHIWEVIRRYGSADLSLIDKDDNNVINIIDYKTGTKPHTLPKLRKDLQLYIYEMVISFLNFSFIFKKI